MRSTADDPADPRITTGAAWDALVAALGRARERVLGADVPAAPRDRSEGFQYLLRFLASGVALCIEHADPDHPSFVRMVDFDRRWGLDCPDCLYLYATVRGDAVYRVFGRRGTANHLDLQVNWGHFANGSIAEWGTIASLAKDDLACDAKGGFELFLGGEERAANWLPLAPNAEFVLLRQYFDDWERETPGDFAIERVGAPAAAPPLRSDELAGRIERLIRWLERGDALWDRMSRGLWSMPDNSLVVHLPENAGERAGLRGQAYGMGNFRCAPDEAVVVAFAPPACRHWSVSLADWWWQSLDYATRSSSLNGAQTVLDPDGVARIVIAHADPGVPNWLDTAGHERGSLVARFLLADAAPKPALERVPLARVREALHPATPIVTPDERAEQLACRRRAVWRRFRT
jgi:hypothetical protein